MSTLKPLPSFASDEEAEHFVATADLSDYDLSGFRPAKFEFTHSRSRPSESDTEATPSALTGISPSRGEID
ncbi:hypothetical protein HGO38_14495 [Rhizobium sp. CG5]|uniref:CopG family antitoxin n=1 Tax=Rhizobium sp. CG5 TaxID=2726076 RepID=UPI0020346EBB|nr:CopG family antitoxin [Rhizobium sp. CG5]MCM2474687.1 hypothetical protein [Rhizobium sp. CG5]